MPARPAPPQPSPHITVAPATLCHPPLVCTAYVFYSYRHQLPMKAAKEVGCRRQLVRWRRSCIAGERPWCSSAATTPHTSAGCGGARAVSGQWPPRECPAGQRGSGGAEARAPYRRRRAHSHQPGLCSDKWGASCPDVWSRGRRASPLWRCSCQWPPSGRCRSWSYEAGPAAVTASAWSVLPYMRPPQRPRNPLPTWPSRQRPGSPLVADAMPVDPTCKPRPGSRRSRERRPVHNCHSCTRPLVIPAKAGIQGRGRVACLPPPCSPPTLPYKAVAPATANKQTPFLSPFQLQKPRQKSNKQFKMNGQLNSPAAERGEHRSRHDQPVVDSASRLVQTIPSGGGFRRGRCEGHQ